MKRLLSFLLILFAAGCLFAQQTRKEVVKSTTPAQDSKANSDSVPSVYAIEGKFERIVILRFKHQADLLLGLNEMIRQQGIKNAVILSAAGSVRGYHYHTVSNRTFPSKNIFIKDPTDPADIISMNGYIINGRAHPHITFASPDRAFGGHLEEGTEVFTFAVITIGVLDDKTDLSRVDDKTYR